MMGRKPDLPCDIEQVIDLLGIEVIRDTGTQLHCRCPFCADRKAHMNVKIRDNVFRCNRCGKGGGILHLYAEFCEVTLHTAYEELCKIFGPDSNEKPREYKRRRKIIETAELPIASAEVRDNTYSNLLSLLTLCPTHQASLKERGLTRDEIDWLGYRTTPTTRLRRIVTELLERGCVLDGVPGFYCQKDTGQWTLDIRGSGIMLPDRNLNGQIEAIQVRLDKVYNQKFYNLTSIDQYYGTQSKCCPHYVGVHEGDEVVCLTEGVMKADIAYSFALGTSYESGFVGLTGVPSYSQFERALEDLNSIGVVRINIMVDSDYQVKEEVRKARDRYVEMGVAAGFEVAPITWTQKRKGVDDLYKHLFLYGDNVIEKHGINRDSTGDREKTRYLCGKQGIFTRDRALIRPGFIRQLETRASTRSASFFHALGSPGRPHNGGGEAGAYRTRNGAKPLKQGHLRAKRGPLGPSRKSQQQTKRTGFAAHGHSIAETAPEGKRASCANGALIRA